MAIISGREEERAILEEMLHDTSGSQFVAVYGRRRIGKTFLVRNIFREQLCFEMSGLYRAELPQQLQHFADAVNDTFKSSYPIATPGNWLQAFRLLAQLLEKRKKRKQKQVVFLDELPWLATARSGFLTGLEYFWNSWASVRTDIVLVVCGSAASWMIQHIVNNRGGLYNRITCRIHLQPFTLYETEVYLKIRSVVLDRYQLIQLYMVMGGVPQYLNEVKPGMSAAQVIDAVCFSKTGPLRDEFTHLFTALFDADSGHTTVIRALAKRNKGLSRRELIQVTGLPNAGSTTRILEELEKSGFVSRSLPFGKQKRDTLYRSIDGYINFYLHFIENSKAMGAGTWLLKSNSPAWRAWSGFAFENIWLQHLPQLKKAMGIAGVYTEVSSWLQTAAAEKPGVQIDLVLDRADRIVHLCEIKFSQDRYTIDKVYGAALQQKMWAFREATGTTKTIFITFISSFGAQHNQHYLSHVQGEVLADALFEK